MLSKNLLNKIDNFPNLQYDKRFTKIDFDGKEDYYLKDKDKDKLDLESTYRYSGKKTFQTLSRPKTGTETVFSNSRPKTGTDTVFSYKNPDSTPKTKIRSKSRPITGMQKTGQRKNLGKIEEKSSIDKVVDIVLIKKKLKEE